MKENLLVQQMGDLLVEKLDIPCKPFRLKVGIRRLVLICPSDEIVTNNKLVEPPPEEPSENRIFKTDDLIENRG